MDLFHTRSTHTALHHAFFCFAIRYLCIFLGCAVFFLYVCMFRVWVSYLTALSLCICALCIVYRSVQAGFSDDKLNNIHEKLDVVRTTMQENIQQILLNQESVDRINSSAEHLTEQSIAFKSSTKELRNRMFWKMVKMRLLIFFVVCALTAIIVAPIYFYMKKSK